MIIPVKCFTCGLVLANKYRYYKTEVRKLRKMSSEGNDSEENLDRVIYFTKKNMKKTHEGEVLDKLGLHNVCCRRHMLTHVDIE
jgi:DNA-directed RNA polymerase I, II, and III subunit RPABC5